MTRIRFKLIAVMALVASVCVVPLAFAGKKYDGGAGPFLVSCCIGPRVAVMMNEGVNMRDLEVYSLIPPVFLVTRTMMAIEAAEGKTFSEIAAEEQLGGPCGPSTAPSQLPAAAAPEAAEPRTPSPAP